MASRFEYILGDSSFEVKRLAFQAKVWEDMTEGLFDRLGVGRGWKVLEAGAGTGAVFFPLARRVRGRGGRADAVERSPRYAAYLRDKARRLRLKNVHVIESDILEADLPEAHYDLVFARWVFLFLPRVEEHLRKLTAALKPGGYLAIEDYHRDSMAMYPRFASWEWLKEADKAWFATQGGDLNIAGRLPGLYRKVGLELVEARPNIKGGAPGSDVWKWVEAYFLGYLDKIGALPPFTPARARRFRRDWLRAKRDPDALFISPVILDVVGRKRVRR